MSTPGEAAPGASEKWRVHNEFASVTLMVVPHGRGARLQISAGRIETTGVIDATVLEALTLLSESELAQVVAFAADPGNALQRGPRTPAIDEASATDSPTDEE